MATQREPTGKGTRSPPPDPTPGYPKPQPHDRNDAQTPAPRKLRNPDDAERGMTRSESK